ncbi:hypothetical protein [Priestia megaterium]|uniref:hypothetical protein n=1 Tax=Priestia megaterium TaxID=1404 RepID=UPI002E206762|nr:hypothetical protein [Priestia megaterium]MED4275860.1 hypothetical protein [Priestia megaterium]MED4314828.1 hypothetical protein [Priestia megaterium]
MIGGQGEDSCGKSGTDETPQELKQRGGSSAAPRKAKTCTEINSGGKSGLDHLP